VKKIDEESNEAFIKNIKSRDFEPAGAFVLQGRPHIDKDGDFKMIATPGMAGELKSHLRGRGRPSSVDAAAEQEIRRLNEEEKLSSREIGKRVGVGKDAVRRVLNQVVVAK
jgi:hypothetical protein